MNSDTNEIKEIDIEYLPHIMLFLKDGKGPVVYDGDSKLEDLIKFVESDGKDDGEFIEPVEKKSATEISTQKGTSKEMPSVTASNVSNGTVQTFNSCTSRLDICQFLVVQTPMLNTFTLKSSSRNIVCYFHTFENNLGMKRNFTKYLKEICCLSSD